MVRILFAAVVGAIVLFVWGFFFWVALPMGESQMRSMPADAETVVLEAMRAGIPETGVYFVPEPRVDSEEAEAQWLERHKAGPLALIVYNKEGANPMSPLVMAKGFGVDVVIAFLAAFLVSGAARGGAGYLSRALIVVYMGVFAAVAIHGMNWVWMHYPTDHTSARMVDTIVGIALMGLAVAAIVRPKKG